MSKKKLAIKAAQDCLRETFDGLPIVDAKADFPLLVRTGAVKAARGNQRDPANCVLAKACAKQVGASVVAFLRRVAYLELPDAKGNKRVVRYILDDGAAAIVAAFDKGKSVSGEVLVTLRAPTPSQTLDRIREKSKDLKVRRRQAVIRGEIVVKDMDKARYHKKTNVKNMDVRNGTGLIHNMLKKPKIAARRKRKSTTSR